MSAFIYNTDVLSCGFGILTTLNGQTAYENRKLDLMMLKNTESSDAGNPYCTFLIIIITFSGIRYIFIISTYSGRYVHIKGNSEYYLVDTPYPNLFNDAAKGVVILEQDEYVVVCKPVIYLPTKIWYNVHRMNTIKNREAAAVSTSPMLSSVVAVLNEFKPSIKLDYSKYKPEGYTVPELSNSYMLDIANKVLKESSVIKTKPSKSRVVAWAKCEMGTPKCVIIIGSTGVGKTYTALQVSTMFDLVNPILISYDNPAPLFPDYVALTNFPLHIDGKTFAATDPEAYRKHYKSFGLIEENIRKMAIAKQIHVVTEKADSEGIDTNINLYRNVGYSVIVVYKPTLDNSQRIVNMNNRFITEGRFGKMYNLDDEFPEINQTLLNSGLRRNDNTPGIIIYT